MSLTLCGRGNGDETRIRVLTHYQITEEDVRFALSFFKLTSLEGADRKTSMIGKKRSAEPFHVCY